MRKNPLTSYSMILLGVVAVLLAVSVAITIAVDPYNYFHGKRWDGINARKPAAYAHAAWAKQQLARRSAPRAVILGNSRMDIGFDPQSPAWPEGARPVFNLAVPGQSLSGDLENLRKAFAADSPRLVVIGLDFLDFLYAGSGKETPATGGGALSLLDRMERFTITAMSLTAVSDALSTLRQQGNANAENMTAQGFNPFRQYLTFVRQEGHHAIFLQRNVENFGTYLRKPKSVTGANGALSPDFRTLGQILDWSAARKVQVKLVIYPYHLDILEGFRRTGLWPAFEDWKRRVVRHVETSRKQGTGLDVTLWDFSGYHSYATEAVPAPGNTRTHMDWYWEAGHFKSALGNLMLQKMLRPGEAVESGFGDVLTMQNVESVIRRIRETGTAFRADNPRAGEHVQKIIDRLKNR